MKIVALIVVTFLSGAAVAPIATADEGSGAWPHGWVERSFSYPRRLQTRGISFATSFMIRIGSNGKITDVEILCHSMRGRRGVYTDDSRAEDRIISSIKKNWKLKLPENPDPVLFGAVYGPYRVSGDVEGGPNMDANCVLPRVVTPRVAETEKITPDPFTLDAKEAIVNYKAYPSVDELEWKRPKEPELPPRGRYETQEDYETRLSMLEKPQGDFRTYRMVSDTSVEVLSQSAWALFGVHMFSGKTLDQNTDSRSYEAQNSFGAKTVIRETTKKIYMAAPRSFETRWRRTSSRSDYIADYDCVGSHDAVPLSLDYVKAKDSDVKLVRLVEFNMSDPDTYTFSSFTSSTATFRVPFGRETHYYTIEGNLKYAGLLDANNGEVLAVFSKDLKTLHRLVPNEAQFDLSSISCELDDIEDF
jgi:hypothetical protein